ncbi:MAG TPA: TonB family protein [Oculatellaceae cyanobacterium]
MSALIPALLAVSTAHAFNFKPFSGGAKKNTPANTSPPPITSFHDKWAVVLGISSFKDPAIPPVKYGAESANKLATLFRDGRAGNFKNDHLVVLRQDDATKVTTEDVLINGITSKCLPNDLVVIYLSTRWALSKSEQDIIFCCNDTRLANADETGLDLLKVLTTIKRRTQCKNIVLFLDLSPIKEGIATDKLLPIPPKSKISPASVIGRLATLTGVSIISANNLSINSAQTPYTETSYFCRFLLEDLQGTSGGASLSSLNQMISDQVHSTVLAEQKLEQVTDASIANDGMANAALGFIPKGKPVMIAGLLPSSWEHMRFGIEGGRIPMDRPELMEGSGIGTPSQPPAPATGSASGGNRAAKRTLVAQAPTSDAKSTTQDAKGPAKNSAQDDDGDDEPAKNVDLGPYITEAKKTIQSKWLPPKGLESHQVVTVFSILRDGTISEPQISQPSGIAAVDQAAMDALKAASPLPPLPPGSPKLIQLRYRFAWRVKRD